MPMPPASPRHFMGVDSAGDSTTGGWAQVLGNSRWICGSIVAGSQTAIPHVSGVGSGEGALAAVPSDPHRDQTRQNRPQDSYSVILRIVQVHVYHPFAGLSHSLPNPCFPQEPAFSCRSPFRMRIQYERGPQIVRATSLVFGVALVPIPIGQSSVAPACTPENPLLLILFSPWRNGTDASAASRRMFGGPTCPTCSSGPASWTGVADGRKPQNAVRMRQSRVPTPSLGSDRDSPTWQDVTVETGWA